MKIVGAHDCTLEFTIDIYWAQSWASTEFNKNLINFEKNVDNNRKEVV